MTFRVPYLAKDIWPLNPLGLHRIFFRGADDTCSFPGHGPATEQHAEETRCRNHDKGIYESSTEDVANASSRLVACILQSRNTARAS